MRPGSWMWPVVGAGVLCASAALGLGMLPAMGQTKPTGVPVPEDSPIFKSFLLLEKQPAYRTTIFMEPSDPKTAQMMTQGMGMTPMETVVKGGARQVSFHYKMPAMDQPGTVDDWEILAVVQNGRGARLITSPAVPRIMRYSEQMVMMQMAILDRQASMAMAHAAAQGPMGAITAGLATGRLRWGISWPCKG
jgi:hypothetical protein